MWELQNFNILRCLVLNCFCCCFFVCLIMLKCLYWFLLTLAYLFILVPLNLRYNRIKLVAQPCTSFTQRMFIFFLQLLTQNSYQPYQRIMERPLEII